MNSLKIMNKQKFEYFLNAVHYCMWLFERKSQDIINRTFLLIISPIPKYLLSSKYKERFYRYQKQRMTELDKFFNDKKSGFSIGLAHHNFGAFYSIYPCIFSFVIEGLYIKFNGEMNTFVILVIFAIPVGICYIPAYKAVFSNDKYLKYFKLFEKEDEHWHKKWKRRTIAFILGAIASLLLGIITAYTIVIS
ncbi:hypothetical protein [uncultured Muribaculum sp.]|jgi:hypothetical protein|uniref:hypothetical protein n=2 Tax=uncultured Muribaculum sp. TaxID=1918613 RepID=UPI0025B154BE|nr:hypothetical protein [uncultured Muribaculum sp.]